MAEFSERVENTVGKGEIARYEQFFYFHNFSRRVLQTLKNQGRVNIRCWGKQVDGTICNVTLNGTMTADCKSPCPSLMLL